LKHALIFWNESFALHSKSAQNNNNQNNILQVGLRRNILEYSLHSTITHTDARHIATVTQFTHRQITACERVSVGGGEGEEICLARPTRYACCRLWGSTSETGLQGIFSMTVET
jgi:hypothetical protein